MPASKRPQKPISDSQTTAVNTPNRPSRKSDRILRSSSRGVPPSSNRSGASLHAPISSASSVTVTANHSLEKSNPRKRKRTQVSTRESPELGYPAPKSPSSVSSNAEEYCYYMRQFTLREGTTMAPLDLVAVENRSFYLSGYIAPFHGDPWAQGSDSEDDEDLDEESEAPHFAQDILLTRVHVEPYDVRHSRLIWAESTSRKAWFILEDPSEEYAEIYRPFLLQHVLCNILVNAVFEFPEISWEGVRARIMDEGWLTSVQSNLLQGITAHHLKDVGPYIVANLKGYISSIDTVSADILRKSLPVVYYLGEPTKPPKARPKGRGRLRKKEKVKLRVPFVRRNEARPSTFSCTPIVGNIAGKIFPEASSSCRTGVSPLSDNIHDMVAFVRKLLGQDEHGSRVSWVPPLTDVIPPGGRVYRQSAIVNDVVYSVGDIVCVRNVESSERNEDPQSIADSERPNDILGQLWFAKIIYMYHDSESPGDKHLFHARWLQHGSKTLLGEVADPREIFDTNECDPVSLYAILAKCSVTVLPLGDALPFLSGPMDFFCRYTWSEDDGVFTDFIPRALDACASCELKQLEEQQEMWSAVPGSPDVVLSYNRKEYHVGDFVYYAPGKQLSIPYEIGQIMSMSFITLPANASKKDREENTPMVALKRFVRSGGLSDTRLGKMREGLAVDERRLYPVEEEIKVPLKIIFGKCNVKRREDIEDFQAFQIRNDHFYVKGHDISTCLRCDVFWAECALERQAYLAEVGSLPALGLFCGCGGLSLGLQQSYFIRTKYAIDRDEIASKIFSDNHASSIIWQHDSRKLLKHVLLPPTTTSILDMQNRMDVRILKSEKIPIIFANLRFPSSSEPHPHFTMDKCVKRTVNALAWVEHLEPSYVVFESVMNSITGASQVAKENTIIKFICRSLLALGYQVRPGLLQAAAYGVSLDRRSFVVFAARSGRVLPSLPEPTHVFSGNAPAIRFPTSNLNILQKSSIYAPLPAVTLREALKDIRGFQSEATYPELTEFATPGGGMHPLENRAYSVEELTRLQGFPRDFVLGNSDNIHQRKCLAGAVPPPLALAVGRELGEALMADWRKGRASERR